MAHIKLEIGNLETLRTVNPRLMSYNVEMTEVTGGTFWKAYTPGQIAGTEEFPPISGMHEMANLMQWYDPIDTTNPACSSWQRNWAPFGSAFPALGQPRPTRISMARVCPKATRAH